MKRYQVSRTGRLDMFLSDTELMSILVPEQYLKFIESISNLAVGQKLRGV